MDIAHVKKIYKKIVLGGYKVPEYLHWITLMPGDFQFVQELDVLDVDPLPKTFQELQELALLMALYKYPRNNNKLLLLSSLRRSFVIANKIEDEWRIDSTEFVPDFEEKLEEIHDLSTYVLW